MSYKYLVSTFIAPLLLAWILWVSTGLVDSAEKFATIGQKLDYIIDSVRELKRSHGIK